MTDLRSLIENLRRMSQQLDPIQCEIVLQAADALTNVQKRIIEVEAKREPSP